jgi:hypothetical protein
MKHPSLTILLSVALVIVSKVSCSNGGGGDDDDVDDVSVNPLLVYPKYLESSVLAGEEGLLKLAKSSTEPAVWKGLKLALKLAKTESHYRAVYEEYSKKMEEFKSKTIKVTPDQEKKADARREAVKKQFGEDCFNFIASEITKLPFLKEYNAKLSSNKLVDDSPSFELVKEVRRAMLVYFCFHLYDLNYRDISANVIGSLKRLMEVSEEKKDVDLGALKEVLKDIPTPWTSTGIFILVACITLPILIGCVGIYIYMRRRSQVVMTTTTYNAPPPQ